MELLPADLRPMLAQPAEGPLDSPDYAYELKWDGMRALVGMDGDRVRIRSRTGIDATDRFPELAALPQLVTEPRLILDGEIVRVVDGKPSFTALQPRMHAADPAAIRRLAAAQPTHLILFDVLLAGERSLLNEPWSARREILERVVRPGGPIELSPAWDDGAALWATVQAMQLEGVMAKRRRARYTPGKRSPAWLKIKRTASLDVVVGGWTEGERGRSETLGALIVGEPRDGSLRYLGHVGTGFDAAGLREAFALLHSRESADCPFDPAPPVNARPHWVRPELVCEVRYQTLGGEGRLREPVFLRWRPEKTPEECAA